MTCGGGTLLGTLCDTLGCKLPEIYDSGEGDSSDFTDFLSRIFGRPCDDYFMIRVISYCVLGLCGFVLAACARAGSEAPAEIAPAAAEPAITYDFKAMLTRTDEVEVCVNHFVNKVPACNETAVACVETLMRPACQCQSDYTRLVLREAGANPAMENAVVQITLNFEVGQVIWPEEGLKDVWREFGPFLDAYANEHFGEDASEKMEVAGSAVQNFTEAQKPALMLKLPSCAHVRSVWDRYIPDADTQAELYVFLLDEFPASKAIAALKTPIAEDTEGAS